MLRAGKLPAEVLAGLLARVQHRDPRVLVGPGIGRDAAIIDIGNGRVLVATSDPVTFAAEDIGWYAVNINANDVACMGVPPAWFMATLLLPPGAPDDLPSQIFDQTIAAADELGVALIGGHTEVTAGIERPIMAGTMLGEAEREDVVTGDGVVSGDAVLLAGSIAIEGTALLAKDAGDELRRRGIDEATITRSRNLLRDPGISIVNATRGLCATAKPRMMHDPTEGGLATALQEMAVGADSTIAIDLERVNVVDETRSICAALGLDPLGLLASGALLAIVAPEDVARVTNVDNESGFRVIGRVEAGEPKVILGAEGTPLPMFDRDELARFFDGMAGGR